MNTVDLLREAKGILSDPDRWTKRGMAVDVDGMHAEPGSPNAVAFCMLGAVTHVAGREACNTPAYPVLKAALSLTGSDCVGDWNDEPGTTHAELIDAFDRAILSLATGAVEPAQASEVLG